MSKIDSHIALVITDKETNAQIQHLGVGLLEIRVDLFKKLDCPYILNQIKQRSRLKIPLLLTVRNQKNEGALKIFSDKKKWEIIEAALPLVDVIDIELSSSLLKKTIIEAKRLGKKVIVSSHHLKDTPHDLESIFKKSLSTRADAVKIAAKANSNDDVMSMMNFTWRHRKHPLITMSLGPIGAISRLVLPALGSRYTYSFLHKPTAAGQLDVMTLKSHMAFYYA